MQSQFMDAMDAVEEAANLYEKGWPRSKVVEHLQSGFGLTEAEANRLCLAVENTRYESGQRAWRSGR